MPPAAVVAGAAVAGAVPGIIAATTGAGKSKYSANNFGESPQYDPNKFEYGGRAGTAENLAGRYAGADAGYGAKAHDLYQGGLGEINRANDAFGGARVGAELGIQSRNMGLDARNLNLGARDLALDSRKLGLQSRGLGLDSRERQTQAANLMLNRAQGRDLISDRESALARNDLSARMRSAAASARGPAALANAQSDAMAAEAQGLGQINSQGSINAMREQRENEQAAFDAGTGIRSGDATMHQGDLVMNQNDQGIRRGDSDFEAGAAKMREGDYTSQDLGIKQGVAYGNIGTSMLNSGAQYGDIGKGYAGLEKGVMDSATDAGLRGQGILSASHTAEQGINSGTVQHNAGQDMKYIEMIMGGMEGGAKMGAGMGGGGLGGGSVPSAPVTGGGTTGGVMNSNMVGAPVPGRADGGPVKAGGAFLVGERGPEIIVPKQDGYVIPNHALGEDYGHRTAMYSMDKALAEKEEERRNMPKTFHRDTPAEQHAQREAYFADLSRQADDIMAKLAALKSQGPTVAVARDEGELDAPPAWLADYMAGQDDIRLAKREDGGPIKKDQPTLVGEKGPEAVIVPEAAANVAAGLVNAPAMVIPAAGATYRLMSSMMPKKEQPKPAEAFGPPAPPPPVAKPWGPDEVPQGVIDYAKSMPPVQERVLTPGGKTALAFDGEEMSKPIRLKEVNGQLVRVITAPTRPNVEAGTGRVMMKPDLSILTKRGT